MAKAHRFVAIDFGAESGRALLGTIADGKIDLHELHRCPNGPVGVLGHNHWDILRLFQEAKQGIKVAIQETGDDIDGIGVDTWGVDFGLFDEDGELLGNPFHYRDTRTEGMMEKVFEVVPRREVFAHTGIQFMQINTLYQLYSMVLSGAASLKHASTLLMTPDILNYWLTGKRVSEFSIASTSQCLNPRTNDWARELLKKLSIPTHIFPEIVMPGQKIGDLAGDVMAEVGSTRGLPVFAPATHDTGDAVAAVPAEGDNWAYISSGTWSLMGMELHKPLINDDALNASFTNEGGVCGTYRFLKNIMGLWLVQECRRTWQKQGDDHGYGELMQMAQEADGFTSVVDPNTSVFLSPGDMPARIQQFCKETGQPVPESKGQIVRCALDSLALEYRITVESLDKLSGKRVENIHIVGGGTQNTLLNQLAADCTGRTIVTGPIEATAIGNVLTQAMGADVVSSLAEARSIVRNSFDVVTYKPRENAALAKALALFRQVRG
jgi:rhamnulokinase